MNNYSQRTPSYSRISSIPGWFPYEDYVVMGAFLGLQEAKGDICEVGPFLGKTTVLMAAHLRNEERMCVVDLFDCEASSFENRAEVAWNNYGAATRRNFEHHFRRFHPDLPCIVEGDSATLLTALNAQQVRFFHIDGSHTRHKVAEDLALARGSLTNRGVIALDDYRTLHAPGVAAAAWAMVQRGELCVLALTGQKMYLGADEQPRLVQSVCDVVSQSGGVTSWHNVASNQGLIPRFAVPPPLPAHRRLLDTAVRSYRSLLRA